MGSFATLIGGYVPQVGDEVVLRARVSEFFNMTQLSSTSLVQLVGTAARPWTPWRPPSRPTRPTTWWTRGATGSGEGMRGRVLAGSVVTGPRDVFASTADSEVWVVRGDSAVAQRTSAYARRAFRDAHPLDDLAGLVDNGNGYRILLGPLGVKGGSGSDLTPLPPARVFDSMSSAVVGGVDYSFNKYRINPVAQPAFTAGPTHRRTRPRRRSQDEGVQRRELQRREPLRLPRRPVRRLRLRRQHRLPGRLPPFDYVPTSAMDYDEHLGALAEQVANDLHAPDVLLVQEAEDQDICTVSGTALACGTTDDRDGKPDTLQELALRIAAVGGPRYDAAYDRDGADDRGIVAAFLYRADRVELLPAAGPVLGATPDRGYRGAALAYNTDVQNPKALNADLPSDVDTSTGVDGSDVFTRAPQVGHFRVWRNGIDASGVVLGMDRPLRDLEPLLVDAQRARRSSGESRPRTWRRS